MGVTVRLGCQQDRGAGPTPRLQVGQEIEEVLKVNTPGTFLQNGGQGKREGSDASVAIILRAEVNAGGRRTGMMLEWLQLLWHSLR